MNTRTARIFRQQYRGIEDVVANRKRYISTVIKDGEITKMRRVG